ncbi:hypothetical protein SCHPADRAFT_493688 [Schizopora paradoxa]|uniref:Uncharacterized protein n=1 Tax=Schizopora paradoxa TaxID=27342 RepID=A0A0H2RGM2_9AGAM|nr:hypothetical protein SCHPADRAFT_493688 [Schizopora paradoxa]
MAKCAHVHTSRNFYPGSCRARCPIGWGGGGRPRRRAEREQTSPARRAFSTGNVLAGSAIRDSGTCSALAFWGISVYVSLGEGWLSGLLSHPHGKSRLARHLLVLAMLRLTLGACNVVLHPSIRNRSSRAAERVRQVTGIWEGLISGKIRRRLSCRVLIYSFFFLIDNGLFCTRGVTRDEKQFPERTIANRHVPHRQLRSEEPAHRMRTGRSVA